MTISARKITAFQKLVASLADHPSLGSTALLKQWFDSSTEEVRVALNGVIDDLIATTPGSSGADQIGSATITGVTGNTVYAQLVDLKVQLNQSVLGQIPDGTVTPAKLSFDPATQVELDAAINARNTMFANLKTKIRMGGMV